MVKLHNYHLKEKSLTGKLTPPITTEFLITDHNLTFKSTFFELNSFVSLLNWASTIFRVNELTVHDENTCVCFSKKYQAISLSILLPLAPPPIFPLISTVFNSYFLQLSLTTIFHSFFSNLCSFLAICYVSWFPCPCKCSLRKQSENDF